jgi:hypothetical protein
MAPPTAKHRLRVSYRGTPWLVRRRVRRLTAQLSVDGARSLKLVSSRLKTWAQLGDTVVRSPMFVALLSASALLEIFWE